MAGSPPVSLCVQPAGVQSGGREQGIAEEAALKKGMEAKLKKFAEKGNELYAKA